MQHAGSMVTRAQSVDTLIFRLAQISGTLSAVRNTYDDAARQYMLAPEHMEHALWAMDELLEQARVAANRLI